MNCLLSEETFSINSIWLNFYYSITVNLVLNFIYNVVNSNFLVPLHDKDIKDLLFMLMKDVNKAYKMGAEKTKPPKKDEFPFTEILFPTVINLFMKNYREGFMMKMQNVRWFIDPEDPEAE